MAQQKRRRSVVKQPGALAGVAASLGGIGTFLPPQYAWIAYAASAILGGIVPAVAAYQNRDQAQRASD